MDSNDAFTNSFIQEVKYTDQIYITGKQLFPGVNKASTLLYSLLEALIFWALLTHKILLSAESTE